MSIFNLREFKTKTNLKFALVVYRGVNLKAQYKISNDSFDHEFGTEKKPDYIEIHSVFCDQTDISEILTDTQIDDITDLIKEGQ